MSSKRRKRAAAACRGEKLPAASHYRQTIARCCSRFKHDVALL